MSTLLEAVIANTQWQLPRVVEQYASGALLKGHHPHAIATLFRRLGISRMFIEGVPDPLFLGQMQSAGAYLYGLKLIADDDKVTSRAGAFWDAVGGQYWEAASEIARHSRTTRNPTWEHEDDFLYVTFLMTRYFLAPSPSDAASVAAQHEMLEQWAAILEGDIDPRLDLCRALLASEEEAFWTALLETAEARELNVRMKVSHGTLTDEDAAWFLPYWGEGLALLRLAERDGLSVSDGCPMIPEIARSKNTLRFDPRAWARVEFPA